MQNDLSWSAVLSLSCSRLHTAATREESRPPDRRTPYGTSASRCRRTCQRDRVILFNFHQSLYRCLEVLPELPEIAGLAWDPIWLCEPWLLVEQHRLGGDGDLLQRRAVQIVAGREHLPVQVNYFLSYLLFVYYLDMFAVTLKPLQLGGEPGGAVARVSAVQFSKVFTVAVRVATCRAGRCQRDPVPPGTRPCQSRTAQMKTFLKQGSQVHCLVRLLNIPVLSGCIEVSVMSMQMQLIFK